MRKTLNPNIRISVKSETILNAQPKALKLELALTGMIIIDMQNGFLAKGGYFDLMGISMPDIKNCIESIKGLKEIVRAKGLKIIYVLTHHPPADDGGSPDSVFWHKEASLALYREHPEYADKLLLPNTWGSKVIHELAPEEDDEIVVKRRYSAFYNTDLDVVLKRHNIKYLLTTGVATNCCVEATVRDAYYRGYFSILISDAVASTGPSFMQEASIFNVAAYYGWVTTTGSTISVLK